MNARVSDPAFPPVVALLPDDAPFRPDQRAWLNGFFAGLLTELAAHAQASVARTAPGLALHVAFASQTGTAEGLARKLNKEATGKAFDARARDLGTMTLDALAKLRHVVIIASTHGEGDPPDSVGAFVMQLESADGTPLRGVKYAVLALGDRNYARFCHFGKFLDERLAALGATRLIDRIEADADAAPAFLAFRERLWPTLLAEARTHAARAAPQDEDDAPDEPEESWTRARPFASALLQKEILNGPESDKEVHHVALSLAGSGLQYEPGDALGVWPRQAPGLVDAVLAATGMDPHSEVSVDGQALELGEALATRRELANLSPATLIKLAKLTGDDVLERLVHPDNYDELQRYVYGRDVVDALADHPGAVAEPQALFDLLPPLAPRLY